MTDRSSIEGLGKITTEPSPLETGPEAERVKAAEKAVAMGKVKDPREAAAASAADEGRGEAPAAGTAGEGDRGTAQDPEVGRTER